MELRDYQEEISSKAVSIIKEYGMVMLAMEVRTGKTFTALATIKKTGYKKILFLTKKKAIKSISDDYEYFKNYFSMTVINYESLHKIIENDFDLIVLDESHQLGTFPKPNNKFTSIKKRFGRLPMILLTGTPSPESYSQLFHQFFVREKNIWDKFGNFYKWVKAGYVTIKEVYTSYGKSNSYAEGHYDKIMKDISPLIINYTQKDAGFTTKVNEKFLYVEMKDITYKLIKQLRKDKVIESQATGQVILADTMVKEQQKVHQLYSGTIKLESGEGVIIDSTKADFIQERFKGKKIGIFYNFKEEKRLLKETFGDDITDDLEKFKTTDKNIMLQIVSGREGISLKEADCLVYFNIAFSALSYWQSRDRLTTMDRKENTVYWVFAKGGLEDRIYKSVQKKKNFTSKMYKKCQ